MVRVGGLKYTIEPEAPMGKRISNMELDGKPLQASKEYVVAGWASVAEPIDGTPVWDAVADYLREKKVVRVSNTDNVRIKLSRSNPGYA
jgi:sulfur-oxidizing protein SoxB